MSVIFDWSGVVKDAMSAHFWVVNRIFKKYGVKEIPFKELRAGWVEPFMMFYNKYLPEMTIEEERSDYKEFMQMSDYPEAKIYLGIGDLLRKLKNNNCFLAVVSADFKNILETEINNFGLVNIFDEIVTDTHDKTTAVQELIDKYNLDLLNGVITWGEYNQRRKDMDVRTHSEYRKLFQPKN